MTPIAATASAQADPERLLSDVREIQKSLFEQASNYVKLVLGLAYVGFFGAWAGTKNNLRPWELVTSALLICLSLFTYVIFEIFQARLISKLAIDLSRTLSISGLESVAIEDYKKRTIAAQERYFKFWSFVFSFCAGTGILGALILVVAFVHSLWRMI